MKTPHKCITCKYYEPYRCTLNDAYIGYLHCDEPTKCRAWRKSAAYKKGGKFYEEERRSCDFRIDDEHLSDVSEKDVKRYIDNAD